MPRGPNENVKKAEELYKRGLKQSEIAKKLGVPAGTIRRWKTTYGWDLGKSERSKKESERSDKIPNARNVKKSIKKEPVYQELEEEIDNLLENGELSEKQKLFCIYYIQCFNATKAYQRAYQCSYETASKISYRLLGNVGIKNEIEKLKKSQFENNHLNGKAIMQKYVDIAFADMTDYAEFGTEEVPVMGAYGPVKVKDENTGKSKLLKQTVNYVRLKDSAIVDGSIISEIKNEKGGVSIKFADRMKALDFLAKHIDMEQEETTDDGFLDALNGTAEGDWIDEEE